MGKAALADLPARAERRAGALQAGEQCPPPHRPKLALEAPGHPPPQDFLEVNLYPVPFPFLLKLPLL